ncbi:MAG: hypothetical protein WA238_00410 [Methylocella sp.]
MPPFSAEVTVLIRTLISTASIFSSAASVAPQTAGACRFPASKTGFARATLRVDFFERFVSKPAQTDQAKAIRFMVANMDVIAEMIEKYRATRW